MQLPKGNQILDRTNSRVKLNQETEKNHSPKDSAAVEVEFPASEVPTHKRLVTEGYMEIRQPTAVKRMRIIVKTNHKTAAKRLRSCRAKSFLSRSRHDLLNLNFPATANTEPCTQQL
ncbi:hypothetical protein WUBG_01568 [Wuchereria bancrofti]|uniref:Uncharacterized protein n=1 Tax=Wuchereria bancrofti TaxID=6293 RepID=J9FJM3_WUCBA|nr:hypothetical protein WUBG_01568 [Wuchereria bancrofti]